MRNQCPWCGAMVDPEFVRSLTKVAQPSPCCGEPVAESIWQVVIVVVLIPPFVALTLYLSKLAYDSFGTGWSLFALIGGLLISMLLQRFIPVVHGPGRGFGR